MITITDKHKCCGSSACASEPLDSIADAPFIYV